jgi:glycosyltransferase involved in cell wall biosynthesis
MFWSILISGIPERYSTVQPLLYSLLETQAVGRMPDVELLYLLDNRRRPVGAKRNALLDMARGEYVSFIDDDDDVAADYVRRIYATLVKTRKSATPADVICFRQLAHLETQNIVHDCTYSLEHYRNRPPEGRRQLAQVADDKGAIVQNVLAWTGPPAHTMVWRRALLAGIRFPEKTFGEDVDFVDLACERATSEIQLGGEVLYNYRWNEAKSATRS